MLDMQKKDWSKRQDITTCLDISRPQLQEGNNDDGGWGGRWWPKENMRRERWWAGSGRNIVRLWAPVVLSLLSLGGDTLYSWSLLTRLDFQLSQALSLLHTAPREGKGCCLVLCVAGCCAESPGGLIGIGGEGEKRTR